MLIFFAAADLFAQKVTIEFDQSADFSIYKTFAIREGHLNSKNPALNSELVKKNKSMPISSAIWRPRVSRWWTGNPISNGD
jgi:hypothetical protein